MKSSHPVMQRPLYDLASTVLAKIRWCIVHTSAQACNTPALEPRTFVHVHHLSPSQRPHTHFEPSVYACPLPDRVERDSEAREGATAITPQVQRFTLLTLHVRATDHGFMGLDPGPSY